MRRFICKARQTHMLLDYIEGLRGKPHAVRKRFALIATITLTGVVTLLWGLSLPSQLGNLSLTGSAENAGIDALGNSISKENADLGKTLNNKEAVKQAQSLMSPEQNPDDGSAPQDTSSVGGMIENTQQNGADFSSSSTASVNGTPGTERVLIETSKAPSVLIATTSGTHGN